MYHYLVCVAFAFIITILMVYGCQYEGFCPLGKCIKQPVVILKLTSIHLPTIYQLVEIITVYANLIKSNICEIIL